MGILADFIVASPEDALRYEEIAESDALPPPGRLDRVEYGGFTPLEPEFLWAVLRQEPWDPERHGLEEVQITDGGESWLFRFPDEFTQLIAGMDEATLRRAGEAWAATEQLNCDPEDLEPVLRDLKRLAELARASSRGLYLWGSL
jgi:hypothetical protein